MKNPAKLSGLLLFSITFLLVLFSIAFKKIDRPTVSNFTECVHAGYPTLKTYPRQCKAQGKLFVEEVVPAANIMTANTGSTLQNMFTEKYPKYKDNLQVNISMETSSHARGTIMFGSVESTETFLAVKTFMNWEIVYQGKGPIPCSLKENNFPPEMLADCSN